MVTDEEILDYLEHFGIKGMRWGVRKSPAQVQARRKERAQKYVDKANKLQGKIDKETAKPYKHTLFTEYGRSQKSVNLYKLRQKKLIADKDVQRKLEGKLSRRQKQVAIGAAAAAVTLAAYGTYQSLNSGNARRLTEKGKAFITKKPPSWKTDMSLADPNLDVDGIMSKVVKHINPGYGQPGSKMNCRRATYAYEMRRRGNDVKATLSTNARGQDATGVYNVLNPGTNLVPPGKSGALTRIIGERKKVSKPFTEALIKDPTGFGKEVSPQGIIQSLMHQPNGARGEVSVIWNGGGGHSMAWEIIHGKPVIFDTQNGKVFQTTQDFNRTISRNVSKAGITRLDNLPLNNDFLMRWLKDA